MMRPRREHLSEKSLSIIGIPKSFYRTSLSDFDYSSEEGLEEVFKFVQKYIGSIETGVPLKKGIFFYGSNGVGKTMLSSIILRCAYMYRYTCKRVTFVDYIDRYTSVWSSRAIDEKEMLRDDLFVNYKGVEYLVLEEVGKEVNRNVSIPILEDLLRYREDHGLVTIICSNLVPKAIQDIYGDSIYSLMRGNMTPVKIVGRDNRR